MGTERKVDWKRNEKQWTAWKAATLATVLVMIALGWMGLVVWALFRGLADRDWLTTLTGVLWLAYGIWMGFLLHFDNMDP
jgi:hypothetical protein